MKLFSNLPASLNGLLVVMGVLAPVLMLAAASNPAFLGLWAGLYVAIGALAALGVFLFERKSQSKAKDFAKEVESNAASAGGLKDPQKIAQMDHMRKEFQRGIDIYQKHGKNLYDLPWYVVVGESESGKTEMLRRSEIGFPDKLQDRWQGSGGTLSMHWWFTNKAVILDTAGRLFVSEGAEAGQTQWVNFLQMLKKHRADCPINGLILVIPSNRLLTHPNPELEAARMAELDRNAGQIAKQMETLQTELGVRFPVYIMITKMDKLNGFREFFGKIDKPEDRYQIVGWSNPAPLGDSFDPQSVAEYMHSVADRLKRRMMSELRNIEPQDPNGLRIDEVDGLYAFPSSFESMTGKLTRYLRHIFTTDEWSAKPPFLRGLYFTSALQQGMVLDEALAAAMGVPFERMDHATEDDGLSLARNRTYFVRDLFLDKIFVEKGLVTTSGKIQSSIRGWKLWVPAVTLLALTVFGAIGAWTIGRDDEASEWKKLWRLDQGKEGSRIPPLATFTHDQLKPYSPTEVPSRLIGYLGTLGKPVRGKPNFGWVFTPAQWLDGGLAAKRQGVYGQVVAETLATLEAAIIAKLTADAATPAKVEAWQAEEWQTIYSLVLLQQATAPGSAKMPPTTADLLKTLFDYAGLKNGKVGKADDTLAAAFARSLDHALAVPHSVFLTSLASRRTKGQPDGKTALDHLLATLISTDDLSSQDEYFKSLNGIHTKLLQIGDYNPAIIDELAIQVEKVKDFDGKAIPLPETPSESKTQSANPVFSRDSLLAAILAQPDLVKHFGYSDLSKIDSLDDGAKALVTHDGALLKQVADTLNLIKPNPRATLSASNIDAFIGSQAPAPPADDDQAKALTKEANKITEKLTALKKSWFKTRFFPQQFHNYLKFPIVRDGDVGTPDDFALLWRLCDLAEQWGLEKPQVRNLKRVFTCFFKVADFTAGKSTNLQPQDCTIDVTRPPHKSSPIYEVSGCVRPFTFDTNPDPPAQAIRLDQPTTIKGDGKVLGKPVPPWGLVKELKPDGSWIFTPAVTDRSDAVDFELKLKDFQPDALESWPKAADFQPKAP